MSLDIDSQIKTDTETPMIVAINSLYYMHKTWSNADVFLERLKCLRWDKG